MDHLNTTHSLSIPQPYSLVGAVLMQRYRNPFYLGKLSFYAYGKGANTLYKQFFFAYLYSPSNTIISYPMIAVIIVLNDDRDD